MCLTLSKKFYLIMLFWVRYKITHEIEFETSSSSKTETDLDSRKSNSAFIMSREMQSSRIAASQSIIENVIYSNVRTNRRSFMFNTLFITNNSQQKISIFIDIWRNWSFELQMIQFACWKWFSKLKTRQRKWLKNTTSNVTSSTNFRTKERRYKKE